MIKEWNKAVFRTLSGEIKSDLHTSEMWKPPHMNVLGSKLLTFQVSLLFYVFQSLLEIKVNHDGQVACMISLLTLLDDFKWCLACVSYLWTRRPQSWVHSISQRSSPSFCQSSELLPAGGNSTGIACNKQTIQLLSYLLTISNRPNCLRITTKL